MSEPICKLPPYEVVVGPMIVSGAEERRNFNLDKMNVNDIWARTEGQVGPNGEGVKLVVLDTGVEFTHPDLENQIADSQDFVGGGASDGNGHGTWCFGAIAALKGNGLGVMGMAPQVRAAAFKVLGNDGSGTLTALITAIEQAIQDGYRIGSLSLGFPEGTPTIKELETVCNRAAASGLTLVVAAGNEFGRPVSQPACYDSCIAVTNLTEADVLAPSSSKGDTADFGAMGVNSLSTWLGGGYANLTGTSMATPFVAGACALILADALIGGRNLSFNELYDKLMKISVDIGAAGRDDAGWGFVRFGDQVNPPTPPKPPKSGTCGMPADMMKMLETFGYGVINAARMGQRSVRSSR